ncbi:MAG TPA: threonine--tRNA ligase, partial [bacterium]|nr:threonine--tRNA ligase [bacterium]
GIGPAIDTGFYYDFDLPRTLIPEDLPILEDKMKKIIKSDGKFEQYNEPKNEAIKFLETAKQPYKVELVEELESEKVSFYKTGDFVDLCKGPHVESISDLRTVGWKLDKIAGAYWKGSEKNKMLQRIYALAFETKDELKKFLDNREEAEKRDHRKIGADLDLFSFHEEGPGFPFWHPKGMVLWNNLLDWWRKEHIEAGYKEIKTPIILSRDLWEESGHWDHYKNNMYFSKIDDRDFAIKPMNCPGGMLLYKEKIHSYREFPLKIAEIGLVHRHELAGVLHGLMRVRAFHQDDAHIFCTEDQIENEVNGIINLIDKMYSRLNLKYHLELSTRPENGSIGSDKDWERAEKALKSALEKRKTKYKLNPGDGAFYGPKIDFHIEDAIGRTWQTGTIQLDFAMPERFNLEYIGENGKQERPVMIHRVIFGSIERFIGILTEHFAGAFPIWLAPIQAIVLPISDKHIEYAKKIFEELQTAGIRIEFDQRNETIGRKIRESEIQKIPYMLIVGDKEIESNKIATRKYGEGDLGQKTIVEITKEILESNNE